MAIAERELKQGLITYDDYMAEDETIRRYDIVDGVRMYMTNPSITHQRLLRLLLVALGPLEDEFHLGTLVPAPCDVLITHEPLRTLQPDLLFISTGRLGNRSLTDPSPLSPSPELVVEILSPSNTPRTLQDRISDYCTVGVVECWLVSPQGETVEILRLTDAGPEIAGTYAYG
jgi:Uma2 family endonuclease